MFWISQRCLWTPSEGLAQATEAPHRVRYVLRQREGVPQRLQDAEEGQLVLAGSPTLRCHYKRGGTESIYVYIIALNYTSS